MIMGLRTFLELFKLAAIEWWNDNTFRLAASLAFYTIFSLAPVLIIAVVIAGDFFSEQQATQHVVREISELIGPQGGEAVRQLPLDIRQAGGNARTAILGALTLLLGSTAVFAELQAALNHIWDVKADPHRGVIHSLVRERLQSFLIVLAVGFLLLVSLVISAVLAAARDYIDHRYAGLGGIWRVAHLFTSFLIVMLLFALIYRYLPDAEITWRDVAVGALVTSVLFTLGKFLIGFYLGRASIGNVYGAAGSFALLLLWVYYSALICFYGAEFTQVYARRFGSRIQPEKHAVRVGQKPDEV